MLIPSDQAALFHEIYPSLLGFIAGKLGGVAGISDRASFTAASFKKMAAVRNAMLDHLPLLDDYAAQNPDGFGLDVLRQVRAWKHVVRGRFIVERDLKSHTVFLSSDGPAKAYAVLGLTTEIVHMLPLAPPVMVDAVLLPWKHQIICDGLISAFNVVIGGGLRRSFRVQYNEAKVSGQVIGFLDPDARGPVPTLEPRRLKSPPIVRFLKNCPRTVAEFKLKFGEPRMDMANDAAREYAAWNVDGSPALDVDYLMLYANIIRHQVLYVYAKAGGITHIAVVDPTAWRRGDTRPPAGRQLLR